MPYGRQRRKFPCTRGCLSPESNLKPGRYYWVNVKYHKHFGEVIYAIENKGLPTLSKGIKKSDIENVYSFLLGIWRD